MMLNITENNPEFEEKQVEGKTVEFAIQMKGPLTFYYLRMDSIEYFAVSEPAYDGDKKPGFRWGEILF